jgi:hypothetical protein
MVVDQGYLLSTNTILISRGIEERSYATTHSSQHYANNECNTKVLFVVKDMSVVML